MAARRKAVIIGVDGADFAYYRKWMAKGLVPNFAKLAERSTKYDVVYENDSALVLRRLPDRRLKKR